MQMSRTTVTIDVDGRGMAAHLAIPDGEGPFPAIVAILHAPGLDDFMHSIVARLADAGFAAVAPDLYHRQDPNVGGPLEKMGLLTDAEVILDVNATAELLRANPAVDAQRLGITGFCMGGRVVYLMAAASANFRAAVAYYGGNIQVPWGASPETPFDRSDEISCPLMFHFGADDTNPSQDDMHKYKETLTALNKEHEFHVYPGAGHAFMNFCNPERYREDATSASWPRTLDFFRKHLGTA
jgi:carboxymethylenebutenolidase